MKEFKYLRPFGKMCLTMGMIPSSYKESLTYEEQLLWLIGFIENTVIPTVNENTEASIELQNLYKELKSYVENYFASLDIQEEIDNKLDEMAESGQLADIIAQYLNVASVLAYSTVTSMKTAENLNNGSICRTLGYHSLNDGGSALYKVREITEADDPDEGELITLNDPNLVAELIPEEEVNPMQFGAYGDGTIDDLIPLENCINYCTNNKVLMTSPADKVYAVSDGLTLETGINVNFKNATLKALNTMDYVLRIHKVLNFGVDTVYTDYTQNITIDCDDNAKYGLYEDAIGWSVLVENIKVFNPRQIGIYIKTGQIRLHNVKVEQMNSVESTGLRVDSTDSEYYNIVTRDCTTGIECNGGSNAFYECHPVMFNRSLLPGSKGFIINSNALYVHPIADTFEYGFYVTNNYGFTLINPQLVINNVFYNDESMTDNPYYLYFTQEQSDNRILISGATGTNTTIVDDGYLKFTNITTWNGKSILANNPQIARSYKDNHITNIPNEVISGYNTYNLSSNLASGVSGTCIAFTDGALVNYRLNFTLGSSLTSGNSIQFATSLPSQLVPQFTRYYNTITNSGNAITIGIMNDNSLRVYARGNNIASDESIVGEVTFIKQ